MEGYHLPPTKIKRQYKCLICGHSTVNPRIHLRHLNEVHDQKLKIVECPYCVYACQYKQKLNRHLRLVHNTIKQHQHQYQQQQQETQQQQQVVDYQQDEPLDLSLAPEIKQIMKIMNIQTASFLEAQLRAAHSYNRPVTAQQVPHLADLQMPDYPLSQFGCSWNYD